MDRTPLTPLVVAALPNTASEISMITGKHYTSVTTTLRRLRDKGKVQKVGKYWEWCGSIEELDHMRSITPKVIVQSGVNKELEEYFSQVNKSGTTLGEVIKKKIKQANTAFPIETIEINEVTLEWMKKHEVIALEYLSTLLAHWRKS